MPREAPVTRADLWLRSAIRSAPFLGLRDVREARGRPRAALCLGLARRGENDFVSLELCSGGISHLMELRHLRYFIAVAEEGSLKLAAEKRLHTAQPSLSRQIRDLEQEVGATLMTRSVHGIELTASGRAFLGHARLAVMQAEAAT